MKTSKDSKEPKKEKEVIYKRRMEPNKRVKISTQNLNDFMSKDEEE